MKFSLFASAALAAVVTASPTRVLEKRETTWCGSYGSLETGGYTVYHNNWGAAEATSGSQCTTFDSVTSGSVVWSTSWTWAGGSSSVKSYSNIAVTDVGKQLSAISSIPSKWSWTYTGSDIVADVSYDLWLAPSASADNSYEIMVWLAAYGGAGPISSTGSPVATPTIAGSSWSLYSGTNGDTTVYSFVATSTITDFDGDLLEFLSYLTDNEGVSTSLYATSLQAGTEPFTGTSAVFKTSAYSLSVESGSDSSSGTDSSSSASSAVSSATPASSVAPAVSSISTPSVSSVVILTSSVVPVAPTTSVVVSTPVTLATSVIPVASEAPAVSETPAASQVPVSSNTPVASQAQPSSSSSPSKGKGKGKCHT